MKLTEIHIQPPSFDGFTLDSIDDMDIHNLFHSLYLVFSFMLPDSAKVRCLFPSQFEGKFIPITDQPNVINYFLGKSYFLSGQNKGSVPLPEFSLCTGISHWEIQRGLWRSSVNTNYYPEECVSVDRSSNFSRLKTFLKAFLHGYVRPDFYLRHRFLYWVPESVTSVTPQAVTFHPVSKCDTADFVTPANQPVTLCPCGCGVTLTGRQKAATPACRKRLERQRRAAA